MHTVSKMPSEKAGDLFKHILSYVNDENPKTEDLIIQLTFEPIKQQLKRDLQKYENKKSELSQAGKVGNLKRWNLDLYKLFKKGEKTLEQCESIAVSRKVSPPDDTRSPPIASIAVSVNDTVNVNVNDKTERESKKALASFTGFEDELKAFDMLVKEKPSDMERFEMQNKKMVNDWDLMVNKFNNTMEGLVVEGKVQKTSGSLMPKLRNYCLSWISNQKTASKGVVSLSNFYVNKSGTKIINGLI